MLGVIYVVNLVTDLARSEQKFLLHHKPSGNLLRLVGANDRCTTFARQTDAAPYANSQLNAFEDDTHIRSLLRRQ
jgi:hypothetical protein